MEDTDWRPSACPLCGEMREAQRTPVCKNPKCDYHVNVDRTMIKPKESKRYLWVRKDWTMSIIENPVELLDPTKFEGFDQENDRIYEIGPEVEVKVSVEVKNKPVYRERSYDFNQKE